MATKLGTLTLDLVAKIGNFTQGMRQASSSAEREMQRASSSVNVMNGMLGKLAATAGAAFSINQVKNYADSYTGMVNKLKLVTSTQSELSRAMDDTHKIAQATASDWNGVLDVYTKFQGLSKRLGIDQAEVARITETVTKTVSMSGQSAAASEAALLQFGQALNTGLLRGAELTSVLSQAPALAKALADGMGVAVGDLKKLGEEGKITSEVMRDALLKMSGSVDAEYAKTATTVSASFNLITTEVTKMVGEFDSATGASKTFVQGITLLSQNMEGVVNSMMVGAAFMAGTYIPAIYSTITAGYAKTKQLIDQTAIQYGAINAEKAAAVSALAQAEAQLVNTQSTLAALAAEKALEVQRLQAQINAAGRMATATRMAQLRQIEVQVTAELTAAETALAAARTRATAAAAAGIGVGRTALGILGGPVGIGITLAAVAAGYLLMKNGAEKATTSIDYQGQKLEDLIVKYRELNTLQRDNETKALADQVQDLSVKFRVASSDLSSFMQALPASDEKIDFFVKLTKEYQNGKISSDAYYKAVKEVNFLTDEQLDKVRGLTGRYDEAKGKFNAAEVAQDALANSMGSTTQKAKEQAAEVARLSEEIKNLLSTNKEAMLKNTSLNAMIGAGADPKLAEYLYEARKAQGILGTSKMLSEDVRKSVLARYNSEIGLNKTLEERAKIEERNKKLIEAQGNAMKVNALVAYNAAKANYAALESAKGLPKGLLSAVNMTESPNSNTARSSAGARGAFQFMPKTAERFNVDVNSVNSSAKGAAEYLDKLLKMFEGNLENALRAYNWGEGNMQNYLKYGSGMKNGQKGYFADRPLPKETREYSGKVMGYMGGSSGVSFTEGYSFDDWLKEQEQFAIEREKLEKEMAEKQKALALEVSTYREKINSELADKLEEIDKAGFDSAKTAELKAEYKKRAEIDIQVSEAAHSDKLASYSDYLKSEEQLLNESFARRQRDLKLDLSLTADEYTIASIALENQRKKEVESLRRDERLDVLETKRDWMGKGEYAREYYALVREEILATSTYSPEKKEAMLQYASSQQNREESYERDQAISDYRDVMGYEENPLEQQFEVLQKMRELDLLNEEAYQNAKLELQAKSTAGYMEGMLGGFASLVDENSKTYAVLFAAQKAFAVAQAMLNIPAAYSKAYDAVVGTPYIGPYIAPAVGAAAAALQVAQAASMKSVNLSGMAHDGIDNIPKEGTWLLDGGER
ncbi:MAG: tape measure protein, partial [Acinetobacter sp.]